MYNVRSSYALNKMDKDAIVYTDADGRVIRLTREDFTSELEFLGWKAWSDENYHCEENNDHVQDNHTLSLEELADGAASCESPEDMAVMQLDREAREKYITEALLVIRCCLSARQFRRLWLYGVEGMSEADIAAREGNTQQGISQSIMLAKKKILHYFS